VLVVLAIARSGRMVVEVLLAEAQSLPGLASPSTGGKATAAPALAGSEPPVQAWLLTVPATVA